MNWQPTQVRRLLRFAPSYLRVTVRDEWQLAILALGGLAPGVAVLSAWLNLAHMLDWRNMTAVDHLNPGWLLPPFLLMRLGLDGVLVGAGVVTLLVGCLGMANVYLASVERRMPELALLRGLGLHRGEVAALLLLEAVVAGLLGGGVGLLAGIILGRLAWPSARIYFQIAGDYALHPTALFTALLTGMLAALLFMGLTAVATLSIGPSAVLRGDLPRLLPRSWREWETAVYGTLFAALLVLASGSAVLSAPALMILLVLTVGLSALLTGGGWLLTRLYERLPAPQQSPLWRLALQGLARHPRHTAGLSLALTTGSYAVGLALLSLLQGREGGGFPVWVAAGVLVAGAGLVLTAAALAALERRREFGLLVALGCRPSRVRHMVLLEYGIVAVGGGVLGALLALGNWAMAGAGDWWAALGIVVVDLLAALLSAWAGAIPVLWRISRWSAGEALRG
jgi:predicted lysophospholipase L1 biosynthesis ABC-type transport system permease subunit